MKQEKKMWDIDFPNVKTPPNVYLNIIVFIIAILLIVTGNGLIVLVAGLLSYLGPIFLEILGFDKLDNY